MKTNGDPKYPIYRLEAKWTEDADPDSILMKHEQYTKGLLPDRVRNSTSFYYMRKDRNDYQAKLWAKEWWQNYRIENLKGGRLTQLSVNFLYEESWCSSWFSHWTFDVGQSDLAALDSFERYLHRMKAYNREHGKWRKWKDSHGQEHQTLDEPVCLMGAQDRWRWSAAKEDNPDNPDACPPCRCEHCKEQGKLRINH